MRQSSQGLVTVGPVKVGQEFLTLFPPDTPPLSNGWVWLLWVQGGLENMHLNMMWNS